MDDRENVYPTHSCFDDAIEYIIHIGETDQGYLKNLSITHALLKVNNKQFVGQHKGKFAHAWVNDKKKKTILHSGIKGGERVIISWDNEVYFEHHEIIEFTEYTVEEIIEMNAKFLSYGPWEERYLKYCGEY